MAEDVYVWVARDNDGTGELNLYANPPIWVEDYQWWNASFEIGERPFAFELKNVLAFDCVQNGECRKFKLVEVKDDE